MDLKKNNFTVIDIIKSLKDKSNNENNLFILREFSNYLNNEVYDFVESIYNYCEAKNQNNSLNKEETVILEDYYSSINEMVQIIQ
ncbi:TPA: hypothetical protein DEG21_06200 [Patescibacteria group bacterium]|nr:hypothetical protein [Candidatus Gracilibacteria bacterium]